MTERVLSWEGCLNVRDLGGHVAGDGRTTTFSAVVRADSVRHLTPAGWDSLVDYGVRTIVDLRRHDELERDPPLDAPVEIVHVPIDDGYYHELQNVWRQEATTLPHRDRPRPSLSPLAHFHVGWGRPDGWAI